VVEWIVVGNQSDVGFEQLTLPSAEQPVYPTENCHGLRDASDFVDTDALMSLLSRCPTSCASSESSELRIFTAGAQAAPPDFPLLEHWQRASHAALWGLARTARLELPNVTIRCVDVDPKLDAEDASVIARDALHCTPKFELELAVRNGHIYVPRLVASSQSPPCCSIGKILTEEVQHNELKSLMKAAEAFFFFNE